jgi:choline dehydrogenase-like flavoprotein
MPVAPRATVCIAALWRYDGQLAGVAEMIDDLRQAEEGAQLQADLCIVGAGAAGIALAREFLDTQTSVLLLESGGLRPEPAAAGLNEGDSSGLAPDSLTEGRERGLGGTTALWGGQCLPPEPNTFERRPWVAHSGWPFDESELARFYGRAESLFEIEGEVYDERIWDAFGVERPGVDASRLMHRFTVWCPQPHLGRLYRPRLEESRNLRVLLNATTTRIVLEPSGARFAALRVSTPEGKAVEVRARACVVCTGAIENARLLLASDVGNRHDVVGRYFQDHPNGHCALIDSRDVGRLQELYGLLYRKRVRYLPRLVLSPAVQESEQVLSCAAYPVFHFGEGSGIEASRRVYRAARGGRRPHQLRRELGRMVRDAPRLVPVAYRRLVHGRASLVRPSTVTLQTHGEQAPSPDSRVTLSDRRDRLGERLPKVDWRLGEQERRTAEVMVGQVAEQFARLGLGEVRPESWLATPEWGSHVTDSYHHMGTTRLGTDPRTSVLDPDGQVHGVGGLFLTGSSAFPAAGFVNPTLMIAALAIRLGDHLKRELDRPAG